MAEWLRDVSVGEWFESGGEPFEIVGVDAKAGVVLVQHFDGSLEEFEFEAWEELNARACAPPEDPSGALDLDREDDDRPYAYGGGNPLDDLNVRLDDY